MIITYGVETELPPADRVVVVGAFDGLHMGHQFLIRHTCAEATARNMEATVLTFEPVPHEAFAPPDSPGMRLTTADERHALLLELCVDRTIVADFDDALEAMTAEEFARDVLAEHLHTRVLVAAENHRFGRGHSAAIDDIRRLGEAYGFELIVLPLLNQDGTRVSSTAIREYLRQGHVEEAGALLGRNYSLRGTVVAGEGVGKTLGYPTANIEVPPNKLIPGPAVYSALATGETLVEQLGRDAVPCPAAVSIGPQPTFGRSRSTVEAHLIADQSLTLLNEQLEIRFVRRLRPVEKFEDVAALKAQIHRDVTRAAAQVGHYGPGPDAICPPTA